MAKQQDMGTAFLFSKDGGPAPYLIISAHGVQAMDSRARPPDGRTYVFYGPHGKVVTTPPLMEIISGSKHCVPFETIEQDMVEDYWISKYAGSQNKLEVTYDSMMADLDIYDDFSNYHILSVRRQLKGWFGKGKMLLSDAVVLAEKFNKMKYDAIYCCFCRGRPGQPLRGSAFEHVYLDNKAGNVVRR